MRTVIGVIAGVLLSGSGLVGQELSPNAPKFVKSVKAPGLEIRFLDFRWDPAAFDALEKGGAHPAAQRSWVLARLMLQTDPFKWDGKIVPVGPALLILNPARGKDPLTMEIRYIDMREVFVDMNVIAEPPDGETYAKKPVVFKKAGSAVPRLEVSLHAKGDTYLVGVHYGDRETSLTLTR